MPTLDELVNQLPPDLQEEVKHFAEFLLKKKQERKKGKFTFGWAGALKDLKDKYTSVELQHKISEWRVGEK